MRLSIVKWAVLLGVVALLASTLPAVAGGNKVTICHATGSAKNPYVEITVSENGWLNGHRSHGDFLAPSGGCAVSNVPTIEFTASPTIVFGYDTPITLTWSSTNTDSCAAFTSNPESAWTGGVPTSGTVTIAGTGTTTYTLLCTGSAGSIGATADVLFISPE